MLPVQRHVGDLWQRDGRNLGHPWFQVTRVPLPIQPPPSLLYFVSDNSKVHCCYIREGGLSEGVAGCLALLSPKTDRHNLREIFLLPLKKVIYKVRGVTLGSRVYMLPASPRETNSPLPGSLTEAVLELAFASFTGWNHVDATI